MPKMQNKKRTPFKKLPTIEKSYIVLTIIFEISIIIALVLSIIRQNWIATFLSFSAFILILYPLFFKRRYQIRLPGELNLAIIIFTYATLYLGEIHGYYTRFWWWDNVLHISSAIVFGFIGFTIFKAEPITLAIFTFCFALAIGTVWEIFEFAMDQLFKFSMQGSGLIDTMWDLIVDAGGALFASIIGFVYLKYNKKGIIIKILNKFLKENKKIFKFSKTTS